MQHKHLNFGLPSVLKRLHRELCRAVNLLCKYLVVVTGPSCTSDQCIVLRGFDLGLTIFILPNLHRKSVCLVVPRVDSDSSLMSMGLVASMEKISTEHESSGIKSTQHCFAEDI